MRVYYTGLLIVHVIGVAVMAGSIVALALQWRRSQAAVGESRSALRQSMLETGRRLTVPAGSGLVLAGVLMILDRPGLLPGSILFRVKLALGAVTVVIVLMLYRRLQELADVEAAGSHADETAGRLLKALLLLTPVVILAALVSGRP